MDIILDKGQRYGVDPFLIAAICQVESSGRRYATRFEPKYRYFVDPTGLAEKFGSSFEVEKEGQQTSFGYMQVMGAVFREHGFVGPFDAVFAPAINIHFGTKHLANFLKRYSQRHLAAIASYNAGSPRYSKDSRLFVNQEYVDKVLLHWAEASHESKDHLK